MRGLSVRDVEGALADALGPEAALSKSTVPTICQAIVAEYDAWHDFLTDLAERGLRPLLLIVSDGAPGLVAAAEQVFAPSLRQRCLVHRARNVLAKASDGDQAEAKAAYWRIFDLSDPGDDVKVGQQLVDWVQRRIDAFADTWGSRYPATFKCLLSDPRSA